MQKLHLGLSADFTKPDGTAAFPSFDLSPLDQADNIDWSYVPVTNGRIAAADLQGFDALVLLGATVDAESLPQTAACR